MDKEHRNILSIFILPELQSVSLKEKLQFYPQLFKGIVDKITLMRPAFMDFPWHRPTFAGCADPEGFNLRIVSEVLILWKRTRRWIFYCD